MFIIDTNAIINDPYILKRLSGKKVICTTVLQELDNQKDGLGEKARNVREFARLLLEDSTDVIFHNSDDYSAWSNDGKIIQTAKEFKGDLITNDILMSLLSKAYGVKTKKHTFVPQKEDSYTGIVDKRGFPNIEKAYPNEYIIKDDGIFKWTGSGAKRLDKDTPVWGITHRSVEQKFALDALMDDEIKLVTLSGPAGSGKTLLAVAAGLEQTIEGGGIYDRLIVSRPIVPMGNDLGYLPGDINEKLGPWMQPIFDNLDVLFENDRAWENLEAEGLLKLEPLTYIRGRSIPNQFMIIDEAQNLSRHEIKTIITRVGEGTKKLIIPN
jgi:PhoH-like ATPase